MTPEEQATWGQIKVKIAAMIEDDKQLRTDNAELQRENRELREQAEYWQNKAMGGQG